MLAGHVHIWHVVPETIFASLVLAYLSALLLQLQRTEYRAKIASLARKQPLNVRCSENSRPVKLIWRIANRYPQAFERRWAWLFPAWLLSVELEVIK